MLKVKLHASKMGAGKPVVLLHGLFGSSSNLGALARSLQDAYTLYSVDLPNHGLSEPLSNADLQAVADAVLQWMRASDVDNAAVVGHSLGGKVAMQMSLDAPDRICELVVADIAPVEYPPGHDAIFTALNEVASARCRSRTEAREILEHHIEEPRVAPFLLLSLRANTEGVYEWRFNLAGIESSYAALKMAPHGAAAFAGPTLFIKGGDSNYIQSSHREAIARLFPGAQMAVMAGCGHWLHAEQPAQFNSLVREFLGGQSAAPAVGASW